MRLSPTEAVTLARDVIRLVSASELPGVPSAHVIRITPAGTLTIEGPVAANGRAVSRAAQLLDALLPGLGAPPELRAPGALRLAVARGLGTLDIPTYASLESFADALDRFAASDSESLIRDLAARWLKATEQAPVPAATSDVTAHAAHPEVRAAGSPTASATSSGSAAGAREAAETTIARVEHELLTVSDIRRARRSTGLPLLEVSQRSRIPLGMLRQLEWGYLRNWPRGLYGRTQLVRYARAAGLDEHLVIAVVWPMLDEAAATATPDVEVVDAEPADQGAIASVPVVDLGSFNLSHLGEEPRRAPRRRKGFVAAAGLALAAALILLAMLPAMSERPEVTRLTGAFRPAPAEEPAPVLPVRDAGEAPAPAPPAGREAGSIAPSPEVSQSRAPESREDAEPARSGPARASTPIAARAAVVDAIASAPGFATEGSATFQHADTFGPGALTPGETTEAGALLRVTRVVDDQARNFHARPSPDGEQIAFDSDRDGERGVYVARADGSGVRRVSGPGFAAVPSWSPDGRTLAFVRAEPDNPSVWNLWTVDFATGGIERITSNRSGQPWGASWFPDGRRLLYSLNDRLIVLSLDTGRQRVYQSPRKGQRVRTPAVSPDGRLVIFQVYRDGAWLLDLGDGSMRKVLADPSAEEYAWSPDGRRVAYHSRRSGEWGVWLMAKR